MASGKPQLGWMFGQGARKYVKYVLWAVVALYLINLIVLLTVALRSFADVLVLFGAFWLGALIGLLLGCNVQESEQGDYRVLGVCAWAVAASVVFVFLRYVGGDMHEMWLYPMGLVGGFIIGVIWKYAAPPD
jgi:hypothetical protein